MQLGDFDYTLPEALIADLPPQRRSDSRLLCLDRGTGRIAHRHFRDLAALLRPEDLLVFNDTRVIPARLYGRKESGGRVEVLIERLLAGNEVLAQLRASKSPKPGTRLCIEAPAGADRSPQSLWLEVRGREDEFFRLRFPQGMDAVEQLRQFGHIPLPPYIKRAGMALDAERYQTVYAARDGAVAAPTAGLHFDEPLLAALSTRGVELAFVTLHVGAGTFQPVRVDNIEDHRMHSEWIEVGENVCRQVRACRERGGRVIGVGTTSVRCLETAAVSGCMQPYTGDTDIFIYPGFRFNVVDAMISNFHLPKSTLLMLVAAFCSKKMILDAYGEAVEERYRFFSYGDAMFLHGSASSGFGEEP